MKALTPVIFPPPAPSRIQAPNMYDIMEVRVRHTRMSGGDPWDHLTISEVTYEYLDTLMTDRWWFCKYENTLNMPVVCNWKELSGQ